MNKFARGEIWVMDLDPTVGSEIQKTRPAVIISRSDFNLLSKTLTVVPISSSGRFIPGIHVPIAHLKPNSHAVTPQIRIAAKERLKKKLGRVTDAALGEMERQLKFYLDLMKMPSA